MSYKTLYEVHRRGWMVQPRPAKADVSVSVSVVFRPRSPVPLTYPAHQAPAIALKVLRPERFDGTALCVGAAMPDLAFPFGSWLAHHSHTAFGLFVWALPVTTVVCAVLRWRAAAGIFAHLPDAGPLRLRSLRVIGTKRPSAWITLWSGALGAVSHIVIDAFTHNRRWGAEWLGIDEVIGSRPGLGEYTGATLLQYVGHTAGSVAAILLLLYVARRRLLERWYGQELVDAVRQVDVAPTDRLRFWSAFGLTVGFPVLVAPALGREPLFVAVAMTVAGLVLAGSLAGEDLREIQQPVDADDAPVSRQLRRAA
jgi:hypothetical protein